MFLVRVKNPNSRMELFKNGAGYIEYANKGASKAVYQ
jgi:hypothetical protein